ncbi:unnamed protein product, partial [Rotaria sp. Silwood1]
GQNYEKARNTLIDNISSYVLTPTEERLLYRQWNFWIKGNSTKTVAFRTVMKMNGPRLKLLGDINPNNIHNIINKEFNAIKTMTKS